MKANLQSFVEQQLAHFGRWSNITHTMLFGQVFSDEGFCEELDEAEASCPVGVAVGFGNAISA